MGSRSQNYGNSGFQAHADGITLTNVVVTELDYNLNLLGIGVTYMPCKWIKFDLSYRYLPSPVNIVSIYYPTNPEYYSINLLNSTLFTAKYIHKINDKTSLNVGGGITNSIIDSGIDFDRTVSAYTGFIFQFGAEYSVSKRLAVNIGANYETKTKPDRNDDIFNYWKLDPLSLDLGVSLNF